MKRMIMATAALSLLAAGPAMADPGHGKGHGNGQGYGPPHAQGRHDNGLHKGQYKRWARGERLPSYYLASPYYVDYHTYHLRPPPRGYRYVRVDEQVLLVALATGLIASIILNS
jgi:Ni/Co efflux regulator RcnB